MQKLLIDGISISQNSAFIINDNPEGGRSGMQQLKGIKILVVDDEQSILQFLELGLQNEGFEVQTAQDGITAITLP
nr:hypothetical protein [Moorella thermoacetica]